MSDFFNKVREDLSLRNPSEKGIKEEQYVAPMKEKIIKKMIEICENQKIIVEDLKSEDTFIDEDNLSGGLQKSIILESHISTDIYNLERLKDDLEVLMNKLYGILYDHYKHKNKFKLKGAREIDVYIFQDEVYNVLKLRIKNVESLISRSERNYNTIKQKTSALRELIRMKTQILFNEGRKGE